MPKGPKAKAVKATIKEALPPISSLNQDQLISRRWTGHLDETADYYFDDEIKDVSKNLTGFPPDQSNILKIPHARNIPTSAIQDSGSIKQEAKIKPALRQSLNLSQFSFPEVAH